VERGRFLAIPTRSAASPGAVVNEVTAKVRQIDRYPSPESAPSPTDATDQARHWKTDPAIPDRLDSSPHICENSHKGKPGVDRHFFLTAQGASPVEEFLRGVDAKTYNRFLWSIEQLRLRNVQAREPLAKHLEGKIWELRRESATNIYRLLYAVLSGRRILLLHGFQKKTQKTPRAELDTAQRRLAEALAEEGGVV